MIADVYLTDDEVIVSGNLGISGHATIGQDWRVVANAKGALGGPALQVLYQGKITIEVYSNGSINLTGAEPSISASQSHLKFQHGNIVTDALYVGSMDSGQLTVHQGLDVGGNATFERGVTVGGYDPTKPPTVPYSNVSVNPSEVIHYTLHNIQGPIPGQTIPVPVLKSIFLS